MSTMAAEEETDPFGMPPWNPDPAPQCISMPSLCRPRDIYLSSEDYIALLEAKLKKINRKTENGNGPSSKDMIRCLSQTKETQMKNLTEASVDPYLSNHDYTCDEQQSRLAALHRRLYPERQALNPEELKTLVENDVLGKTVLEMKAEEQERMEKEWKRRLSHPQSPSQKCRPDDTCCSPEDPTEDPTEDGTEELEPQAPPTQLSHPPPATNTASDKEQTTVETKEVNTAESSDAKGSQLQGSPSQGSPSPSTADVAIEPGTEETAHMSPELVTEK